MKQFSIGLAGLLFVSALVACGTTPDEDPNAYDFTGRSNKDKGDGSESDGGTSTKNGDGGSSTGNSNKDGGGSNSPRDAGLPNPNPNPNPNSDAGSAGGCVSEREPNDTSATANFVQGNVCGTLSSGTDVDYFAIDVPNGQSGFDITLTGLNAGSMTVASPNGASSESSVSGGGSSGVGVYNGPGRYIIRLRSAQMAVQRYTLEITR